MKHYFSTAGMVVILGILFALLGSRGSAQDASVASSLEDAQANLQKTLAGYKVGDPARYWDLFGPLHTEIAALSPDGKHLAYAVRHNDDVHIRIVAVDEPTLIKTDALIHQIERFPQNPGAEFGCVEWLCWVNTTRLLISSSAISRKGRNLHHGVISAMDIDGSGARVLATPGQFTEIVSGKTNDPGFIWTVGLDPDSSDSIIVVSNTLVFRPRSQLLSWHSLNAVSGEVRKLGEAFSNPPRMLHDASGRGRITTPLGADVAAPILYQPGGKPESALNLDQATGIRGFVFSSKSALGEGSIPLGFAGDADKLYYASNLGRDTYGIYCIDLRTKRRLPGALESPERDLLAPQLGTFESIEYLGLVDHAAYHRGSLYWRPSPQLVIDRFNHELAGVRYQATVRTAAWLKPELQAVQERLAAERPGRSAEIMEWDESLNRFLVREQTPADAGAYFVLDLQENTYTNFVRRGPEPEDGSIAQPAPFDFKLADGSRIDGLIALPRDSKVKKIPLVLLCPDYPWQRRGASYQPEFEALTRMGFAVAIYNGRGVWGTGIKERQKLKGDYVGVQVADAVAVADHLAATFPNVSAKAVALFGQGHGGHVALRALQLHPQRFRCAVTVDAWVQGSAFFDAVVQAKDLKGSYEKVTRPTPTPLTEHPELIKSPVFTIVEFSQTPRFHANTALYRAVKRNAPESELFVQTDKLAERPDVLARQWARTESFLNYVLYNFSVKIGELEVLPESKP